jgi:hypothetical protein
MKFVSRAEWGAAYPQGNGPIPGPVLGVTCHWEGPHMGAFGHDRCALKVRTIERFHATVRGWAGIAYNLVVCPHGYVFEGRGAGIRSAANGTSSIGGNDQWYAVCYLGGVGDGFTAEGRAGFADAITYLRQHGAGLQVNGHRDHHSTECPGDEIYVWAHGPHPAPVKENPNMALLADLDAARRKHGASRIKAARVLLRAIRAARGPIAATRIRAALAAVKGMK